VGKEKIPLVIKLLQRRHHIRVDFCLGRFLLLYLCNMWRNVTSVYSILHFPLLTI